MASRTTFKAAVLLLLVCSGFVSFSRLAQAQSPVAVSPCELAANAAKYHKRVVQVRGFISVAFENFTLATNDCGAGERWIWLSYAGDEPTPTMSTVNDQARKSGSAPILDGKRLELRRDASLDLLKKRLTAERLGMPGGKGCYDRECYLYDVKATITGTFLAAPERKLGGYGHLGCCHLLIIQAVDDVDPKRTNVPAGGQFDCKKESRTVDATIAQSFNRRSCKDRKDLQVAVREQLTKVAAQWGDTIDPQEGTIDGYFLGEPTWHSKDLRKSYSLRLHYKDLPKNRTEITGAEITRALCDVIHPPYPQDVPIDCRNLWSEFPVSKAEAQAIQKKTDAEQEKWRLQTADNASKTALEEAARRWNTELAPDITFRGCGKLMEVERDQFVWCTWADSNAMQALTVQLTRFGYLRRSGKWETVPWIVTRGDGISCRVDDSTTAQTRPEH